MGQQIQNIAFILDGNRRWARERNLPTIAGHKEGAERLKECVRWCNVRGIPHVAVYAFSSENWNRASDEVQGLMELMSSLIATEAREIIKEGMRIRIVGDRTSLAQDLQDTIRSVEKESEKNTKGTLWVCLSYGGRAEIVAASNLATKEGEITEKSLTEHLWTAGMPDPDIVVRTGGRHRISNFLLWQSAYSEIFFSDTLWPDFSEKELDNILAAFASQGRTFGI